MKPGAVTVRDRNLRYDADESTADVSPQIAFASLGVAVDILHTSGPKTLFGPDVVSDPRNQKTLKSKYYPMQNAYGPTYFSNNLRESVIFIIFAER